MTADIPNFGKKEIPHEINLAPQVADKCYEDISDGVNNWAGAATRAEHNALAQLLDGTLREAAMYEDDETHTQHLNIAKDIPPGNIFVRHALSSDFSSAYHNTLIEKVIEPLLDQEKNKRLVMDDDRQPVSRQSIKSPLLEHVIETCARNGQTPNDWITKYGVDKAHKWELSERYLTSVLTVSQNTQGVDSSKYMQQYANHALQLVRDTLPEDFVMEQIPIAVEGARIIKSDNQTAQELVDHFYDTCLNYPTTLPGFKSVVKMGLSMLDDLTLVNGFGGEDFIRQTVSNYEARLRENGEHEYSILLNRFNWDMNNDAHYKTPPSASDIVDRLKTVEGELIAAAGNSDPGKYAAVLLRDSYLKEVRFDRSLANGDLADAWTYLEGASLKAKAGMLSEYLTKINTTKAAEYPQLDPLTEMAAPYLNYIYRFASATREPKEDTIDTLKQLAIECAYGISAASPEEQAVRFDCMSRAQEYIQHKSDRNEAMDYARYLVTALRDTGADYQFIKGIALELAKAGDQTELQRIRTDIDNSNQTQAVKLLDKWHVVKAIRYPKSK